MKPAPLLPADAIAELTAIADDLRRLAGEIAWPLGAARVRVLAEELAVLAIRIEAEERKSHAR
jgi:hypothetical protein